MNLANTSYKDLDIGQQLYIVEECGIDCSYFITCLYLTEIHVNAFGVDWIRAEINTKYEHHDSVYDCKDFYRIFITQEDAIKYCEESGWAYGFLWKD